jgi:hypothetical protein
VYRLIFGLSYFHINLLGGTILKINNIGRV